MRLIDADRLLQEKRMRFYYHLPNGDVAIPIIDIKHAPTVEQPRWIPVSERLPEDGERVLAITESGNQFVGFHTQFSGWHFEYVIHPTHWMPLPEPPKDGDRE